MAVGTTRKLRSLSNRDVGKARPTIEVDLLTDADEGGDDQHGPASHGKPLDTHEDALNKDRESVHDILNDHDDNHPGHKRRTNTYSSASPTTSGESDTKRRKSEPEAHPRLPRNQPKTPQATGQEQQAKRDKKGKMPAVQPSDENTSWRNAAAPHRSGRGNPSQTRAPGRGTAHAANKPAKQSPLHMQVMSAPPRQYGTRLHKEQFEQGWPVPVPEGVHDTPSFNKNAASIPFDRPVDGTAFHALKANAFEDVVHRWHKKAGWNPAIIDSKPVLSATDAQQRAYCTSWRFLKEAKLQFGEIARILHGPDGIPWIKYGGDLNPPYNAASAQSILHGWKPATATGVAHLLGLQTDHIIHYCERLAEEVSRRPLCSDDLPITDWTLTSADHKILAGLYKFVHEKKTPFKDYIGPLGKLINEVQAGTSNDSEADVQGSLGMLMLKELDKVKNDFIKHNHEQGNLQDHLNMYKVKCDTAIAEADKLRAQLAEKQNEYAMLQKQFEDQKAVKFDLVAQCNQLKNELAGKPAPANAEGAANVAEGTAGPIPPPPPGQQHDLVNQKEWFLNGATFINRTLFNIAQTADDELTARLGWHPFTAATTHSRNYKRGESLLDKEQSAELQYLVHRIITNTVRDGLEHDGDSDTP